jgi:2,4-dienoyl-CoA reductase-like NADH-dependent reductase (Old Yellow Enzyme family)
MLEQNLPLPCGVVLKNRIGKSALSENMAELNHRPNKKFNTLYRRWAQGGAGLVISGNIMVDSAALGEPRNVVIDQKHTPLNELKEWAKNGSINNTSLWVQLNHPGKQSPKFLSKEPVSPSAIPFAPPMNNMFAPPRKLTKREINKLIKDFAFSAGIAKEAGFNGVQIHAAHGYLISQFLSPLHNQRTDEWGGSPEKRMKFIIYVYEEIRKVVGSEYPIGVKLNSADFQKGGFSEEESLQVAVELSKRGIDLIEISGGTYEAPKMMEGNIKESTKKREAYFLDYGQKIRKLIKTPIMLTGGFRTGEGMEEALSNDACDIIGLGRSCVLDPSFPNKVLKDLSYTSLVAPLTTGIKKLDQLIPLEITWYTQQLHRIGKGNNPKPNASTLFSTVQTVLELGLDGIKRVRSK